MKCIIAVLVFVMLFSCTRVINVNLNNASPQIVIEGTVMDRPGPYTVQITQTVNFNADNNFPPILGALVIITDNTAATRDTLSETSPGIYSTHAIQGIPGHSYQLYVLSGGQEYTAVSIMPLPVKLDSVTFIKRTGFFGEEKNRIMGVANFQDPAGIPNYYTFNEIINGQPFTKTTFTFSDRLSDGRYINYQLNTDSTYIHIGDTVTVEMNNVDENVYNYFNTLQNAANGNTSTSPSNPISNISNNALGYFSAGSINSQTSVAK